MFACNGARRRPTTNRLKSWSARGILAMHESDHSHNGGDLYPVPQTAGCHTLQSRSTDARERKKKIVIVHCT